MAQLLMPARSRRPLVVGVAGAAIALVVQGAPTAQAGDPPPVRVSEDAAMCSDGALHHNREVSAAVDPRDPSHLVAVWMQGAASGATMTFGFAESTDSGRTWRQGTVGGTSLCAGGTRSQSQADPSLTWAPDGTLYLASLAGIASTGGKALELVVQRYLGFEQGWTAPLPVSGATRVFSDKEVLVADRQVAGRVWVAWPDYTGSDGWQRAVLARSDDHGATWHELPAPPSDARQNSDDRAFQDFGVMLAQTPAGRLVLGIHRVYTSSPDKQSLMTATYDADAEAWTAWQVHDADLFGSGPSTEGPLALVVQAPLNAALASTPDGVALAWSRVGSPAGPNTLSQPSTVHVLSSTDGTTWSPSPVQQTPKAALQVTTAASPRGQVLAWYDFRDYDAARDGDVAVASVWVATRRGESPWQAQEVVGAASLEKARGVTLAGPSYAIGEYASLVETDRGWLALWALVPSEPDRRLDIYAVPLGR